MLRSSGGEQSVGYINDTNVDCTLNALPTSPTSNKSLQDLIAAEYQGKLAKTGDTNRRGCSSPRRNQNRTKEVAKHELGSEESMVVKIDLIPMVIFYHCIM